MNDINNDLFFTCSFIEYIARCTCNTKKYIIDRLGKDNINKIFSLSSIYHNENIDKIRDEFIDKCSIEIGNYDVLSNIKNDNPPTYWDMGKVYSRLIIMLDSNVQLYVDNIIKVLSSFIIEKLDNYDSSLYYDSPSYIYECYKEGKIL